MQKKDTTKRPQSKATGQSSTAELARLISGVLAHPETPAVVYNALADSICELNAPPRFWDSAEYLEMCLDAYKKGGAR